MLYVILSSILLHSQKPWYFSVNYSGWHVNHKTMSTSWISSTWPASRRWPNLQTMYRCLHGSQSEIWCYWFTVITVKNFTTLRYFAQAWLRQRSGSRSMNILVQLPVDYHFTGTVVARLHFLDKTLLHLVRLSIVHTRKHEFDWSLAKSELQSTLYKLRIPWR